MKEASEEAVAASQEAQPVIEEVKKGLEEVSKETDAALKRVKPDLPEKEHFSLLKENIRIKKKIRGHLERLNGANNRLRDARRKFNGQRAAFPKIEYKADKKDEVDRMLGDWINQHGCPIKIRRLGGGFYMFGEKKIFAKIINGKLVIRVGGGYMNIDEFMKHYGMQEYLRQQRMEEEKAAADLEFDDIMNQHQGDTTPNSGGGKTPGRSKCVFYNVCRECSDEHGGR